MFRRGLGVLQTHDSHAIIQGLDETAELARQVIHPHQVAAIEPLYVCLRRRREVEHGLEDLRVSREHASMDLERDVGRVSEEDDVSVVEPWLAVFERRRRRNWHEQRGQRDAAEMSLMTAW